MQSGAKNVAPHNFNYVVKKRFRDAKGDPLFPPGVDQDADEFITAMLDALHEETNTEHVSMCAPQQQHSIGSWLIHGCSLT
jgi:ubiquitin C-terminal hydrolase